MNGKRPSVARAVLRRLWPKRLWARVLVVALPLLLLAMVLDPVVGSVRLVVSVVDSVLRPVLGSPQGRLIVVCASLFLGAWLGVHLLRDRFRSLRAGLVLRQHLDALHAYLGDDRRRARDLWQGIARGRGPLPSEYPMVREDACLKLSRLALEDGAPGEALAWALRVAPQGLPTALGRSQAQLRARAVVATRESLPESIRREIESALSRWPEDVVLLRLYRDRLEQDGDLLEAARVQEKVWRAAEPTQTEAERERCVETYRRAAEVALAADAFDGGQECLDAVRRVDAGAEVVHWLDGELRWRRDDLEGALRAWARVPGSAALARCAQALDAAPDRLSPRAILECCPTEGGLLLVARAHARRGEVRQAVRAARRAARALGPSPTVSMVLAEVLRLAGDSGAEAFADEATARLLRSV
ncbi:MAG: hypothetical protein R3F56_16175 [Planctomycetota bacterium]